MHTQPDLQPIEEKAVEVRAAAGKGLGLFAVADIQEVGDEKGFWGLLRVARAFWLRNKAQYVAAVLLILAYSRGRGSF